MNRQSFQTPLVFLCFPGLGRTLFLVVSGARICLLCFTQKWPLFLAPTRRVSGVDRKVVERFYARSGAYATAATRTSLICQCHTCNLGVQALWGEPWTACFVFVDGNEAVPFRGDVTDLSTCQAMHGDAVKATPCREKTKWWCRPGF